MRRRLNQQLPPPVQSNAEPEVWSDVSFVFPSLIFPQRGVALSRFFGESRDVFLWKIIPESKMESTWNKIPTNPINIEYNSNI